MIFPVGFHQKADILSQSAICRAFDRAPLCEALRRSENSTSIRRRCYATMRTREEGEAWKIQEV